MSARTILQTFPNSIGPKAIPSLFTFPNSTCGLAEQQIRECQLQELICQVDLITVPSWVYRELISTNHRPNEIWQTEFTISMSLFVLMARLNLKPQTSPNPAHWVSVLLLYRCFCFCINSKHRSNLPKSTICLCSHRPTSLQAPTYPLPKMLSTLSLFRITFAWSRFLRIGAWKCYCLEDNCGP